MPQLGSGPTTDTSGSGYFSKDEYVSILQKARQVGVRIVPEIVAPGHNVAAIKSMEYRFKKTAEDTYRLLDPDQKKSNHSSVQNFYNNAMNPCVNGTWNFLDKVTSEIKKML